MRLHSIILSINLIIILLFTNPVLEAQSYKIVDTGQTRFYDNHNEIEVPALNHAFYGQDASYSGYEADYTDNGDGTVTDHVTGLMWQQSTDLNGDGMINVDDKRSHAEALAGADTFRLGGYDDWRLPSIKECYSLFMFTGEDPSGYSGTDTDLLSPFIDTTMFEIGYGDIEAGERIIDGQYASSSVYVGTTMNGDSTMFGVNFVDGRIKGYPMGPMPGQNEDKQFYVLYVRGNPLYGENNFINNGDSTISDLATGLMWMQGDSEAGLNWESALEYAQTKNATSYLGYSDWRVPNAKELQSILDYTRSPATTNSAAIDPIFDCSQIIDEGGEINYPFYWSSSTHLNMQNGAWAAYICFGEALGFMPDPFPPFNVTLLDVHGAGAQRSDPKAGSADDYPQGHGPQGDVVRVQNYVRLVRDINAVTGVGATQKVESPHVASLVKTFPNPFNGSTQIVLDLEVSGITDLRIFDIRGNEVAKLASGQLNAGKHEYTWDGRDLHGTDLSAGLYLVRLTQDDTRITTRLAYVK